MPSSKPAERVQWSSPVDDPHASTSKVTFQLPSAYDAAVLRRRAPTPETPSLASDSSGDEITKPASGDLEIRGRSQVRTQPVLPRGLRILSKEATRRRAKSNADYLDDEHSTPFLTTDQPPTPESAIRTAEHEATVLEPSLVESVSTSVSELLGALSSPLQPLHLVDMSTLQYSFQAPSLQLTPPAAGGEVMQRSSSSFELRMNASPFSSNPTYVTLKLQTTGPFKNHRDTFALLGLKKGSCSRPYDVSSSVTEVATGLPYRFLEMLATQIDHQTYLKLRLTSRAWCTGITKVRPLRLPGVFRLPEEVIQLVYSHLSPADFNAARHTCRNWMVASLDSELLELMLRRGGWWKAVPTSLKAAQGAGQGLLLALMLHSHLARECAISGMWSGNGLAVNRHQPFQRPRVGEGCDSFVTAAEHPLAQTDGPSDCTPMEQSSASPFVLVSHYDISELGDRQPVSGPFLEGGFRDTVHFSTSVCGRFIMVTDGWRMFLYQVDSSAALTPAIVLACPQKILALNMDTSRGRYAVAALLEGRTGLVFDLALNRNRSSISHQLSLYEHSGMEPDNNSRTMYHDIGSENDPPLSVAICPSRSCVAFGCSSGIDIHWVDADNDLYTRRWLPLTTSSDFLYFLTPEPVTGTVQKLRLVSSQGLAASRERNAKQLRRSSSQGLLDYSASPSTTRPGLSKPDANSDRHPCTESCLATPLSDGHHVLFTDLTLGRLCLSTDSAGGPAPRLARRVVFEGPSPAALPHTYAAGRCLSAGVRIAAAYGDEVWLFSVPGDVFDCRTGGRDEPWAETYASPAAADATNHDPSGPLRPVWPLRLAGQLVARVPRVSALAIDADRASPTLWAFSADGTARAWHLRSGPLAPVRYAAVQRCGAVLAAPEAAPPEPAVGTLTVEQHAPLAPRDPASRRMAWRRTSSSAAAAAVDADGDVVMAEAPSPPEAWGVHGAGADGFAGWGLFAGDSKVGGLAERDEGYFSDVEDGAAAAAADFVEMDVLVVGGAA